MVKYIRTKSSQLIKFDKDTENINYLDCTRTYINHIWVADEDGVLNNEEVKAGDVIIEFYAFNSDENQTIVIKDQKVKDFYKELSDYYNKHGNYACECECEITAN